jgi:hypothetical protein
VHEQFMGSAGHRANVLDPRFTHGGVGAAAADGKMFQGYVQNTRMYTELFMEAAGSAPPPAPPPSGTNPPPSGGGGGGGGGASAPTQTVASPPKPSASRVEVDAPTRPKSTAGLDGTAVLVTAPDREDLTPRHLAEETAAARGTAMAILAAAAPVALDETAAGEMEVSAVAADENPLAGFVGAIIGFLFG